MAIKRECDICGCDCNPSGFYQLSYNCLVAKTNKDICYKCYQTIKIVVKSKTIKIDN